MPRRTDKEPSPKQSWLEVLKNHPVVAVLGAVSAVTVGLATFTGSLRAIIEPLTKEEEPPKTQTMYMDLSGQAISLLLEGRLDGSTGEAIDAKPMIWKNDVFNEALELQSEFSYTVEPDDDVELLENSGTTDNQIPIIGSTKIVGQFEESLISPDHLPDEEEADPGDEARTELAAMGDEHPIDGQPTIDNRGWKVAFQTMQPMGDMATAIRNNELGADSLLFSRKVSCPEVSKRLQETNQRKSTLLTRYLDEGCTDTTFDEIANHVEGACAGSGFWSSDIVIPRLVLSVAAVKNITDKPISVEIKYESGRIIGIAPIGTARLSPRTAKIGDGTVPPGAALIIPLELNLAADEVPRFDANAADESAVYPKEALTQDILNAVASSEELRLRVHAFVEGEQPRSYSIRSKRILDDYGFTPYTQPQARRAIGPVVRLRSLQVNGREHDAHVSTADETYITAEATVGSCPYLYATDTTTISTHLGTVLVGRDAPSKRGLDFKRIGSWPTSATISELDRETTFLHGIWAICEHPDSTQTRIAGTRTHQGSWPVMLARRDSATFEFRPLPPTEMCSAYFVATDGFYVPDGSQTSGRVAPGNPIAAELDKTRVCKVSISTKALAWNGH